MCLNLVPRGGGGAGEGFSNPQEDLAKIFLPWKATTKFQTLKMSSDRKFQASKRSSHVPVTIREELPPGSVCIERHRGPETRPD